MHNFNCNTIATRQEHRREHIQPFNGESRTPLGADADGAAWVQYVVRVPQGGLPHALRRRDAHRHYLNRLLLHALQRWCGQGPDQAPAQSAARLGRRSQSPAPDLCSLLSVPHARVSFADIALVFAADALLQAGSSVLSEEGKRRRCRLHGHDSVQTNLLD